MFENCGRGFAMEQFMDIKLRTKYLLTPTHNISTLMDVIFAAFFDIAIPGNLTIIVYCRIKMVLPYHFKHFNIVIINLI